VGDVVGKKEERRRAQKQMMRRTSAFYYYLSQGPAAGKTSKGERKGRVNCHCTDFVRSLRLPLSRVTEGGGGKRDKESGLSPLQNPLVRPKRTRGKRKRKERRISGGCRHGCVAFKHRQICLKKASGRLGGREKGSPRDCGFLLRAQDQKVGGGKKGGAVKREEQKKEIHRYFTSINTKCKRRFQGERGGGEREQTSILYRHFNSRIKRGGGGRRNFHAKLPAFPIYSNLNPTKKLPPRNGRRVLEQGKSQNSQPSKRAAHERPGGKNQKSSVSRLASLFLNHSAPVGRLGEGREWRTKTLLSAVLFRG